MNGAWSTPFDETVQPGLRPRMVQHADGHTTILRPRRSHGVTPPAAEDEALSYLTPPAPPCDPVSVSGLTSDPLDDPLQLGVLYTYSALVSGTEPITYNWLYNSAPVATTPTFSRVLEDGDILGKDPTGLGGVFVRLEVENACGEDSTSEFGFFIAQGTPP
jgi:hypothetical protein